MVDWTDDRIAALADKDLKTLLANGNVRYTMISQSDGKTQTIVCSRLNLETGRTDQGQTYHASL